MYIFNLLALVYFYPVWFKISGWVWADLKGTEMIYLAVIFFYLPLVFNSFALLVYWSRDKLFWTQFIVWVILFHWFWHMGWL
jgi:hypothetical protein